MLKRKKDSAPYAGVIVSLVCGVLLLAMVVIERLYLVALIIILTFAFLGYARWKYD